MRWRGLGVQDIRQVGNLPVDWRERNHVFPDSAIGRPDFDLHFLLRWPRWVRSEKTDLQWNDPTSLSLTRLVQPIVASGGTAATSHNNSDPLHPIQLRAPIRAHLQTILDIGAPRPTATGQ
jgi:hypothetical protein